MAHAKADPSRGGKTRFAGFAFLLVIVATILKSMVWRLKGTSPQRESERFWDLMARDFDRNAGNERVRRNHLEIVEITRTYLDAGDRVLDYGCGTGTASIEIADRVRLVHGIDISGKMIEAARRKASLRKLGNVEFTRSTVFDARFERESFDTVLALNVLHLLTDAPKALSRIHELLKPAGTFVSVTECLGEKRSALGILISVLSRIGVLPRFRFFAVSGLEATVNAAGFDIVRTKSFYDFGPLPNRLIVAKKAPPPHQ